MLKVAQLLKFVSEMNPQNTPTRLCFFNFLRAYSTPEQELTPDFINLFFSYCLDYPHWVGNKNQLGHEVQFILENFNGYFQQKLDLAKIRFPQFIQLVEVEHFPDLVQLVTKYIETHCCTEKDSFRVVSDQNKRAIVIILKESGALEVRSFDKKFTIIDGELQPLRRDLALFYTDKLELDPSRTHKIEIAPYITAQFQIKADRVTGQFIRGYVFQKLAELKNDLLQEQTRLLYPIKRLEQFFLDRRSDPYYQDLTSQLERACSLVQQGQLDAMKWSSIILNQAETALENVFLGDKLLTLLIKDLHHATQNARNQGHLNSRSELRTHASSTKVANYEAKEECLKITPITRYDLTN